MATNSSAGALDGGLSSVAGLRDDDGDFSLSDTPDLGLLDEILHADVDSGEELGPSKDGNEIINVKLLLKIFLKLI